MSQSDCCLSVLVVSTFYPGSLFETLFSRLILTGFWQFGFYNAYPVIVVCWRFGSLFAVGIQLFNHYSQNLNGDQSIINHRNFINMYQPFDHVPIEYIIKNYELRVAIHRKLLRLLQNQRKKEYMELALGVTDSFGNFSAHEHGLGPMIIANNTNVTNRVFCLGKDLYSCSSIEKMINTIYSANISYLKISVGSEMALMLKPQKYWVANIRTIWVDLLMKNNWDYAAANEFLELMGDRDYEVGYNHWKKLYPSLKDNLDRLITFGDNYAFSYKKNYTKLKYLWADVLASALWDYDCEEE